MNHTTLAVAAAIVSVLAIALAVVTYLNVPEHPNLLPYLVADVLVAVVCVLVAVLNWSFRVTGQILTDAHWWERQLGARNGSNRLMAEFVVETIRAEMDETLKHAYLAGAQAHVEAVRTRDVERMRHRLTQASIYLTQGDIRAAHEEIAVMLDALPHGEPVESDGH